MDTPQNYVNAPERCSQQDVINFVNVSQPNAQIGEAEWVGQYA